MELEAAGPHLKMRYYAGLSVSMAEEAPATDPVILADTVAVDATPAPQEPLDAGEQQEALQNQVAAVEQPVTVVTETTEVHSAGDSALEVLVETTEVTAVPDTDDAAHIYDAALQQAGAEAGATVAAAAADEVLPATAAGEVLPEPETIEATAEQPVLEVPEADAATEQPPGLDLGPSAELADPAAAAVSADAGAALSNGAIAPGTEEPDAAVAANGTAAATLPASQEDGQVRLARVSLLCAHTHDIASAVDALHR